jgi:hypothetical protein
MHQQRIPARPQSATCHPELHAVGRGLCQACYRVALARNKADGTPLPLKTGKLPPLPATCHPDRPSRGKGLCQACYLAAWHRAHPAYSRNRNLQKHGEDAPEWYAEQFAAQDGKCAICLQPENGRVSTHLSIDHNHQTGERRKLLCNGCNRGIGLLGDNPDNLERATLYLRA